MNPRFNGRPGGFDPNGQFVPRAGAPVVYRMLTGDHVIATIVFLVLVTLVLTLLLFLLHRLLRHQGDGSGAPTAAIRELEMRYARGEIGRDEFMQRRTDLVAPSVASNLPPAPPPAGGVPPPQPPARGARATT